MITSADLSAQCQRILKASPFPETEITLNASRSFLTRYGDNQITQNVSRESVNASLRAIQGKRTARVQCDQLDEATIARAYERLGRILEVTPDSDEISPLHRRGELYTWPKRMETPEASPEEAARTVAIATKRAASAGFAAAGTYSVDHKLTAYASSTGLELSDRGCEAEFACTIEGKGGTGRGFSNQNDPRKIDAEAVVARAFDKCSASVDPQPSSPGTYDVVLEHAALAELLVYFGWIGLSAKAYLENRIYCAGKLGQKLFDERLSLVDDPFAPGVDGAFFDGQGVAKRPVAMIRNGVLEELASDLKAARKLGRASTGHGSEEPSAQDPVPWNLTLDWAGTKAPTAELVSRVKRGIFVTQFHYTNVVDLMVPSLTGMTRNGTFLIEDGKITKPLKNLRFTQSLAELFNRIEAVSPERERVATFFGGASLAPTALIRGFHFSSGTEF